MLGSLGLKLVRLAAIMLMAGLIGATLIRIAPGFTADEQQLNSSLSAKSLQAIRQARLSDSDVPRYYLHYLGALLRGDLASQNL